MVYLLHHILNSYHDLDMRFQNLVGTLTMKLFLELYQQIQVNQLFLNQTATIPKDILINYWV